MKWKMVDGYIEYHKRKNSWTFMGENANKILHIFLKKERDIPLNLKHAGNELRILTLNKVVKG